MTCILELFNIKRIVQYNVILTNCKYILLYNFSKTILLKKLLLQATFFN